MARTTENDGNALHGTIFKGNAALHAPQGYVVLTRRVTFSFYFIFVVVNIYRKGYYNWFSTEEAKKKLIKRIVS